MHKRFQAFTTYVARLGRSIRRLKAEKMKEFNLKTPHVSIIYYLYRDGALTAKQLCDICEEDKSAVSRSIEFLESEGYIEGDDKGKKRYNSLLKLTIKGEEVGKSVCESIEKVLKDSSNGVSPKDLLTMYKVLDVIADNLEKAEI